MDSAMNTEMNQMGDSFVAEMAGFMKRGQSAEWILARAEIAFENHIINQLQLRRIETLVGE